MTQWLSHELAQGLAFNAGSTFDPPREIKGYALQPDISLGIGRMPLNKNNFPVLTTPALNDRGGATIFPNAVSFPNLALHLRMGLPWRGDAYLRFADATTPPGYKISPTMTAQVQTNSYGAGIRQHFFGGDYPTLTAGAHYNHVRGRTHLAGKFNVDIDSNFKADSDLSGDINWNLNSYGLTLVAHQTYGRWTPFFGFGYNYATGSVRSRLELKSKTFLIADILGEGSERPEQSTGRWITGVEYARPTWSLFANGELKTLGRLKGRYYIVQVGAALPWEFRRGMKILYKKKAEKVEPKSAMDDEPLPEPVRRKRAAPKPTEEAQPDMIFLQ